MGGVVGVGGCRGRSVHDKETGKGKESRTRSLTLRRGCGAVVGVLYMVRRRGARGLGVGQQSVAMRSRRRPPRPAETHNKTSKR